MAFPGSLNSRIRIQIASLTSASNPLILWLLRVRRHPGCVFMRPYRSSSAFKFIQRFSHCVQESFCLSCCCVASVVSDSVRPHRRQPTRLSRPWNFPGKNTGVCCHFLLQCMKVKSESEVAQSCPTFFIKIKKNNYRNVTIILINLEKENIYSV